MKQLDPYTFGDGAADVTLAKLLNENNDENMAGYVSKMLGNMSSVAKSVATLPQKRRALFYTVLRKYYLEKTDNPCLKGASKDIQTYLKNCIVKRLKKIIL